MPFIYRSRNALTQVRTVDDKLDEFVTAKDFGVLANGTSDDLANLQNALDSGKNVILPTGTILLSGALTMTTVGQQLIGEGFGTKIVTNSDTADIIQIGNGTDTVENIGLSNLRIWSTVTKSAGAAIHCRKLARARFTNVYVGSFEDHAADGNQLYNGIVQNVIADMIFDGTRVIGCSNDGIQMYDAANASAEVYFLGGSRVVECDNDGIVIGGGMGGVKLGDGDVSACGRYGVFVDDGLAGGVANREIFFGATFSSDSNADDNVHFGPNSVTYCEWTGAWACGSTAGDGVHIEASQPTGAVFRLTGPRIYNNDRYGLLASGGHILLTDPNIHNNAKDTGVGTQGVQFDSGVNYAAVTGGRITGNGNATSGGYGIKFDGCDDFVLNGTVLQGNQTGDFIVSSACTNFIIKGVYSAGGATESGAIAASSDDFIVSDSYFGGNVTINASCDNYKVTGNNFKGTFTNTPGSASTRQVWGNIGQSIGIDDVPIGATNPSTGAFTTLSASSEIDPLAAEGTAWGIDFSAKGSTAYANSSTTNLAAGAGLILIHNNSNGQSGLFLVGGGTVALIGSSHGGSTIYTTGSSPTATQIAVDWNGSTAYEINVGSSAGANLYVGLIRGRESS